MRAGRPKLSERPVLFYRLDRQPWRAVLALRDVADCPDAPLNLRLETDLNAFAAWVRKDMTIRSTKESLKHDAAITLAT